MLLPKNVDFVYPTCRTPTCGSPTSRPPLVDPHFSTSHFATSHFSTPTSRLPTFRPPTCRSPTCRLPTLSHIYIYIYIYIYQSVRRQRNSQLSTVFSCKLQVEVWSRIAMDASRKADNEETSTTSLSVAARSAQTADVRLGAPRGVTDNVDRQCYYVRMLFVSTPLVDPTCRPPLLEPPLPDPPLHDPPLLDPRLVDLPRLFLSFFLSYIYRAG
jgi:hypothetical protein